MVAALAETVRRSSETGRARQDEPASTVAVDATGLAPDAIGTCYVQRAHDRGGKPMLRRRWLKWSTKHQVLLAQAACSGPYNGSVMLRPLTDADREVTPLGAVLADTEFDSEQNHRHVRERLGAGSVIPAKRGKTLW